MNDIPAESIGEAELHAMKAEGWQFLGNGVRVANGWLLLAVDPSGRHRPVLVADPEDEPDKWPGLEVAGQLELFA